MKIESTKEKMRDYGFINFSGTPENPLDEKGNVLKPIITKKEFRKLKDGKAIDLGTGKCDVLYERFLGVFEIKENESGAVDNGEAKEKKSQILQLNKQ